MPDHIDIEAAAANIGGTLNANIIAGGDVIRDSPRNNSPKQVMKNNGYQQTTSQVVAVDEAEFLVPAWLSE